MTRPVPNLMAPLVDKLGKLVPPWNSWFQQFSQNAPAVQNVTNNSPYTANNNGTLILSDVLVTDPTDPTTFITLTRGITKIYIAGIGAIIPISIGDTVSWKNNFPPIPVLPALPTKVQFLGS